MELKEILSWPLILKRNILFIFKAHCTKMEKLEKWLINLVENKYNGSKALNSTKLKAIFLQYCLYELAKVLFFAALVTTH